MLYHHWKGLSNVSNCVGYGNLLRKRLRLRHTWITAWQKSKRQLHFKTGSTAYRLRGLMLTISAAIFREITELLGYLKVNIWNSQLSYVYLKAMCNPGLNSWWFYSLDLWARNSYLIFQSSVLCTLANCIRLPFWLVGIFKKIYIHITFHYQIVWDRVLHCLDILRKYHAVNLCTYLRSLVSFKKRWEVLCAWRLSKKRESPTHCLSN